MEQIVRSIGVVTFAMIGIVFWMGISFRIKPTKLSDGFRNPGLALQLVHSRDEVEGIIGKPGDSRREVLKNSLKADFVLIVAYWLLFVLTGTLLGMRDLRWTVLLAVAAGLCATAAAAFDILENLRLFTVLDATLDTTTQSMVDGVRHASLSKWSFFFVTVGLLASTFLWRHDWIVLIGYLYLCAFIVGFAGLLVYHPAIQWAFVPLGMGLLLLAFLFTFWPGKFLQGL